MRFAVYLVQKGINSNQVVSGKSGRNYGTAVHVPARGGVALKMTMEEYTAAGPDIVGNTAPNQQWVPDIVPEAEAIPGRGKCGIPAGCTAGPGGAKADAEFIWDQYLFCRAHAPNNAGPIDKDVIPLSQQPPAPAPTPEPGPVVAEPVQVMPVPAVGDPDPSAQVPDLAGTTSRSVVTHEGTQFEFEQGAVRIGKTRMSTAMLEALGNSEPNQKLWFRIVKRGEDGTLYLESKVEEPKDEPKDEIPAENDKPTPEKDGERPEVTDDGLDKVPFGQLQKLAKKSGMKIFQQGREAMVKWVREHPDQPDA